MVRGNITTWMGSEQRPLLAHLHVPEGDVAGAVVLCPPLGREQVASYRTYRQLGDKLARKGFMAVRFAWSGQGDSSPLQQGRSALDQWADDLGSIVDDLRSAGIGRIHLVGLRAGALLMARTAKVLAPASVTLWDPVASGRTFLRYEQALYGTEGLTAPDDGDFHALGYSLSGDDAAALRALKLSDLVLPDVPTARITRSPEPGAFPGVDGTWSSDEMPALLETSSMTAHVPTCTVESIVTWLTQLDDHGRAAPELPIRTSALVEAIVDDVRIKVREEVVELPTGLLGILTTPLTGTVDQSVLYVAASSEPLDGPSGLWAISAREVAAEGAMALRIDKHGTGELGGPMPTDPQPYMPGFADDVAVATRWLTDHSGHRPIGVGLCSGVYFEMVRPNARMFRKVVGINLLAFDRNPADIPDEVAMATDPSHLMVTADGQAPASQGLKAKLRTALKTGMPQPVWRTLGAMGKVHAPDHFLAEAASDTDLVLAFSRDDFASLQQQRGEAAIEWARAKGGPMEVIVDPELDHGLFSVSGRRRSRELVRTEVQRSRRLASVTGSQA